MSNQIKFKWFNTGLVVLAWMIIIIGLIGLIRYFHFTSKYVTTNDAQVEQHITPVYNHTSGYIEELRFDENQHVKKGDILMTIRKQDAMEQQVLEEISAPFDAWVGRKQLQEGQMVKDGQMLLNLISNEKWVIANFRETQIGKLGIGNEVSIKADAYPDLTLTGAIESFSPASGAKLSALPPDNSTGNFVKVEQRIPVRIKFSTSTDLSQLRAGMSVKVHAEKSTSAHKNID